MRAWLAVGLLLPSLAFGQVTSLMQRAQSAVQQYDRGDREAALREFDRFIDVYNEGPDRLSSQDLVAVAIACTYLGTRDPQLFKDAMRAYDRAIAKDGRNLDARVHLARLFLDKYNGADAKRTLQKALAIDPSYVPALVTEARRRWVDDEPGGDSVLARALKLQPGNADALVLRARFAADAEEFERARSDVRSALASDPVNGEALALGMALALVNGDSGYTSFGRGYASQYPRSAGANVAAAELFARVRQYSSAVDWARNAVLADSTDPRAYAVLGLNLLRLGQVKDARASLARSFEADPYNVWVKNTLDLLDTFDGYDEITHGRFQFMIEKPESALLSLYLGELADRADRTFAARYGYAPPPPIRMEVYRSHADFSVRTVGLTGLGALGVSFGSTIAFDSPAAKDAGPFNWGSTAWHEMAHAFTLGASEQRVPRWLSEGLSVYEERRARKGWGQGVTPAFVRAYKAGRLVPPSRLNDGFVRPAYPQQVIHSYYEASLVCEMIARDFGEPALVAMLRGYRDGLSSEQVVRRALKIDLPELDRRFDAYLRQRFGHALAALGDESPRVESATAQQIIARANAQPRNYDLQLAAGRELMQRGDTAASLAQLERARALFPEYVGVDSPYPVLVGAMLWRKDKRAAVQLLQLMVELGEAPNETYALLGDLLLELGDTTRAVDALDGAMFVNPYDLARHEQLAVLASAVKDHRKAIRERRAVLALNPVDKADAFYRLALTYRDAGDVANARRSVLNALEEAPHFEQAQQLLLSLRRTP